VLTKFSKVFDREGEKNKFIEVWNLSDTAMNMEKLGMHGSMQEQGSHKFGKQEVTKKILIPPG